MKRALKIELYKAFHNPLFFGALLVGTLISVVNVIETILRVDRLGSLIIDTLTLEIGLPISASFEGISTFVCWLPLHGAGLGNTIFFTVMPIIATMPYGWSYNRERLSGYYYQSITRMGTNNYYFSKYFSVFMSGGTVILLPLLFDLVLVSMICPDVALDVNDSLLPILNYSFCGQLFYRNRWLYVLELCLVEFIWSGSIACLTFLLGSTIHLWIMIVIVPFAMLLSVDFLTSVIASLFTTVTPVLPTQLFQPVSTYYNPGWLVTAVPTILLLVTTCVGYRYIRKNDYL